MASRPISKANKAWQKWLYISLYSNTTCQSNSLPILSPTYRAINVEVQTSCALYREHSTLHSDLVVLYTKDCLPKQVNTWFHRFMMTSTYKNRAMRDVTFHFHTLWLFTVSEHKTIIYPWAAFGIFGALSGSIMTTNSMPDLASVAARGPQTLLWMWLVVLVFTIANQRLEESVLEDSINKPWRPIPSQRLTISQAQTLLLCAVPTVYFATLHLGAGNQALIGMLLTWMYNDLKGSDQNYVVRNLLNALGLTNWSVGATQVACGTTGHTLNAAGCYWLFIVGLIIFTTLQVQDFRDQAGDLKKGRRTAPLVWGDNFMRWVTALAIIFWSLASPAWWTLGIRGYLMPVAIGGLIARRLLVMRDTRADENTWKLWGLWMASLFVLPLYKNAAA